MQHPFLFSDSAHGLWLPWLESEFGWSHDTARNFIQVWDCFKLRNFRDLNIDVSALYLIAAPKTPEPVRQEVIRVVGLRTAAQL